MFSDAKNQLRGSVNAADWLDTLAIFWDYGYTMDEVYDTPAMKCAFQNDESEATAMAHKI